MREELLQEASPRRAQSHPYGSVAISVYKLLEKVQTAMSSRTTPDQARRRRTTVQVYKLYQDILASHDPSKSSTNVPSWPAPLPMWCLQLCIYTEVTVIKQFDHLSVCLPISLFFIMNSIWFHIIVVCAILSLSWFIDMMKSSPLCVLPHSSSSSLLDGFKAPLPYSSIWKALFVYLLQERIHPKTQCLLSHSKIWRSCISEKQQPQQF